ARSSRRNHSVESVDITNCYTLGGSSQQSIASLALPLAFLNLTVAVGLFAASDWTSRPEPISLYTYPVHMRGSYWRYYTPFAGCYINWSFPVMFGAMGALVILRGVDRWRRRKSQ
ncbi:MAG: hypothetical protein V3S30_04225, partial [Thermoanaerobaculia bacterium]